MKSLYDPSTRDAVSSVYLNCEKIANQYAYAYAPVLVLGLSAAQAWLCAGYAWIFGTGKRNTKPHLQADRSMDSLKSAGSHTLATVEVQPPD